MKFRGLFKFSVLLLYAHFMIVFCLIEYDAAIWAALTCVYVKQIYVYTGKTFDHDLLLGVSDKFASDQTFLDWIQQLFKIQLFT